MKCGSCSQLFDDGLAACPHCGTPVDPPTQASGPKTSPSLRNLPKVEPREEKTILPVRVHDVLSGRYRLESKLGEGGMGTVYVAHDSELDRQVAVKLLASNLVNDPEVVQRFEREARLMAKLDHPNIVPVFDVGTHEGRPYIVMKLLHGDTLAGVLREKGGFSSDQTLRFLRQVAAGLDYLHQRGFIHRDIKAGNIHLSADGVATILDFGILRSRGATDGLTRSGMVMGTPHYMAPEQALGLKDVDHRVDLYALAVVLFECLTGTLPFEADSELRLIQMQAHAPPPELLDRAPWIPKPVAGVMRRALAKRPEDRFSSAAELVKALESAYRDSKGHDAAPKRAPATPDAPNAEAPAPIQLRASTEVPPAASRSRPVVLGAIALLIGAAGWWLGRGTGPTGRTMLVPDAAVTTSIDAGRERLVLAADLDAGHDDHTPDDAGVEVAAVLAPDAGRRSPLVIAPRRKGRLNVVSTHAGEPYWATVSLDGVTKGRTPLLLDLAVGTYTLKVERAGFRAQEREIRIASGKSLMVRIDLTP
ncbi:MAG: protein kinase [Archangium sp.]|nr:protein kinase [Archangium sp.]